MHKLVAFLNKPTLIAIVVFLVLWSVVRRFF